MRLSLLTWLCTSLSAGLPRWSFIALLPLSCFRHVWHRFLGCQSLELFTLSFLSLKLAGSRSATYNLATALLSARGQHSLHLATELLSAPGRASVCSGPCCESSSGSSASHGVWSRCSFCNFDLFLKLFVITSTGSFQDVRISSGTILVQNSRGKFCLFSH